MLVDEPDVGGSSKSITLGLVAVPFDGMGELAVYIPALTYAAVVHALLRPVICQVKYSSPPVKINEGVLPSPLYLSLPLWNPLLEFLV